MTSKRRTWGQYATPADVADVLIGFCLRWPGDRLLDPCCGDGALLRRASVWQAWLAAAGQPPEGALYGVELDEEAASHAATVPGATIVPADFFALDATAPLAALGGRPLGTFDAILGNPPYTRAEWINRLSAAYQLPLFGDETAPASRPYAVPAELAATLTGRAGLHAYFLLHSLAFLREGGRVGFVLPNAWLDVAYGAALKRFLLANFRVLAVIESAVERWFPGAGVNTCLLLLARAGDAAARADNRVRLVQLRQPLHALLGVAAGDAQRVAAVDQLMSRLLPGRDRAGGDIAVRVCRQGELDAAERWGPLLRAPASYSRPSSPGLAPLGRWATIHRGHTTGANDFFYLTPSRASDLGIAPRFRRPLLKSLRGIARLRLSAADCRHELLLIPPDAPLDEALAAVVAGGEARGIHRRVTCAERQPWYSLIEQPDSRLLLAKGIWQRHFAPLADEALAIDQQIYGLHLPDEWLPAAAALLNSVWFALQCELRGRLNLGDGVLWLATYELAAIPLPDLPALGEGVRGELAAAHAALGDGGIIAAGTLDQPDRRALDELVFDLVGLPPGERDAARATLRACLDGRRARARAVAPAEAA